MSMPYSCVPSDLPCISKKKITRVNACMIISPSTRMHDYSFVVTGLFAFHCWDFGSFLVYAALSGRFVSLHAFLTVDKDSFCDQIKDR